MLSGEYGLPYRPYGFETLLGSYGLRFTFPKKRPSLDHSCGDWAKAGAATMIAARARTILISVTPFMADGGARLRRVIYRCASVSSKTPAMSGVSGGMDRNDEQVIRLLVQIMSEHLEHQNRLTAGLLEAIEQLARRLDAAKKKPD